MPVLYRPRKKLTSAGSRVDQPHKCKVVPFTCTLKVGSFTFIIQPAA